MILIHLSLLASCLLVVTSTQLGTSTQPVGTSTKPTCDSPIYCHGDLLHLVQIYEIFPDSKTFVDKMMKYDQDQVMDNFKKIMEETKNDPSKEQVSKFVEDNFSNAADLDVWVPTDYTPNPQMLNHIGDSDVRHFATDIVQIWSKLGRKVPKDLINDSSRVSLIPVPNGFVVPGGRFNEYYYWDSHWIIEGLLLSDMPATAKGMLDNFVYLIRKYGFIPNGGRLYYLSRSQPPIFSSTVLRYYQATGDLGWVRQNVRYLADELRHWINNSMVDVRVDGTNYRLARYHPESLGPRPESYKEDFAAALLLPPEDRQRFYVDIKGGAESGWDFSTRWFYNGVGAADGNVSDIHTSRTIPVDLNSFLANGFKTLYYFYDLLGDRRSSNFWKRQYLDMRTAINKVFWNEQDGTWYDYDYLLGRQRPYFAVSNFAPLWAKLFSPKKRTELAQKTLTYVNKQQILNYKGGTPATLKHSGEQWDFPNAWPPLQSILIKALENLEHPIAKGVAKKLAVNWVCANIKGYNRTGEMFEKYDATVPGKYGGGGEYTVQVGFGWSNGVALELISRYFRDSTRCS